MTDVIVAPEYETLNRYAGFMARFAATPVAFVWLEGRAPVLQTNNPRTHERVLAGGSTLGSLSAMVMRAKRVVSMENARTSADRTIADLLAPLGTALLAFPVTLDGEVVGCVGVIDDLARGWFSDDVSCLMDVAAAVRAHLELRAQLLSLEAELAVLRSR